MVCMALLDAKAIVADYQFFKYSPTKPFNFHITAPMRVMADTVHYKITSIFDDNGREGYTYYQRSDDGLTEYIIGTNGYDVTMTYDSEGRVTGFKQPIHGFDETYTYTEDGRLLTVTDNHKKEICYYTNTGTDSLVWWQNHPYYGWVRHSKIVVTYNNDGYAMSSYDYAVEKGEYIDNGYPAEQYKFDEKGRLISMGENQSYFYYEDRIEVISPNAAKSEYFFDEKGDCVKQIDYSWDINGYWYFIRAYDWTYYYGESTVSNENIEVKDELRISTDKGILYIENSDSSEPIIVSDISGRVIVNKRLSEGTNTIPVNKSGIYIIRKGSYSKKIVCP